MSDTTRHKVKNNKKELRLKILAVKRKGKCAICGETHPACLEFHHIDEKEEEISNMLSKYTEKEIMDEIKKCLIVCANCHRKLHWEEKHENKRTDTRVAV